MATVHEAIDVVSGRRLALKRLLVVEDAQKQRRSLQLFEREFHTLAHLAHPRVVEVYDYGIDVLGPYYTMELLDGGDLREHSPLPWREACTLLYDVCSSLALLHSRRLVHRDVSPRNVRTTRDGSAKLIDFGALVPMGASGQIVGTPPFVPPEVLHRSALDARTDLFSLGATSYFALTGSLAYPAREFSTLHEAWARRPPPPSSIVAGIPTALDALVMSLISLDPAVRPRTAFEVMQRLAAIAGIERSESANVSQAYLSAPVMVGRDEPLAALRARIRVALGGHGSAAVIQGVAGMGRSRMLDACALEAKTAGATVLRANGSHVSDEQFSVAQLIAAQVIENLPEIAAASAQAEDVVTLLFESTTPRPVLKQLASASADRALLQSALSRWLTRVSNHHPLLILVDDVQSVDDASVALLAALAQAAQRRRLLLIVTEPTDAPVRAIDAVQVLKRYCAPLVLEALSLALTESLLGSVFGDVPNLALIAERIYQVAAGNPRTSMELAQWLVSKAIVRYEGGSWSLPNQLEPADLPNDAEQASSARVAELSELARRLAEVHALASHPALSREDYARLAGGVASERVDEAISELLAQQILAGDGRAYVLSHRGWSALLSAGLTPSEREERHLALALLCAGREDLRLERAHHLIEGGRCDEGLDLLMELLWAAPTRDGLLSLTKMSAGQWAAILERGLASSLERRRPPRETYELRRALGSLSVVTDEKYYQHVAADWLAQLKRDSGLGFYEAITDAATPNDRLMRALTQASEQYAKTPEAERVSSPEVAIKGLVYFVLISIALGSRMQDARTVMSLPSILEPFAVLSPIIHAIWQNAIATRETLCDCMPEQARARWIEVDAALAKVPPAELLHVDAVRSAIAYGLGLVEARLGLISAEQRAQTLDKDPLQKVSALSLRKIARLHQGDFDGAERYRKQAELEALHANMRQMFSSTIVAELIAHAMASDLTGVRQLAETIEPLAARFPGWVSYNYLAKGYFEQTRGQLEAAREAFERGLLLAEPDAREPLRSLGAWPRLEAGYLEVLVDLNRPEQAKAHGERALVLCSEKGIDTAAFMIRRALALAEAKLSDYAGASKRLESVIRDLTAGGVSGLELGATYEARARIAIWASDQPAIEEFGRLTAKEYRHGERSPLGARYERLMDEARSAGVHVLPQLTEYQSKLTTAVWHSQRSVTAVIAEKMKGADTAEARASVALQLLCSSRGARSGYLYLYTKNGLQLSASLGGAAPEEGLFGFVEQFLSHELDTADTPTAIETENLPQVTSIYWFDQQSVAHQPLALIGQVAGAKLCAGAVMLGVDERPVTEAGATRLVGAVAAYLIEQGDAQPQRPER
jgi:hypothetical protein